MPTTVTNKQFRLASRPSGLPTNDHWSYTEETVSSPGDGEALVENIYISLDPAMRGWMNDHRSYIKPVAVGDVMRALAVGRVVESRNPGFDAGDYVTGAFGVQTHAVTDCRGVFKVDPDLASLPKYLSPLGLTGMTARCRPPAAGRDYCGVSSRGCRRSSRGPDRQDQGMPRGRHRRR
jgi:NADPH-dependent curcumin reductase CurA